MGAVNVVSFATDPALVLQGCCALGGFSNALQTQFLLSAQQNSAQVWVAFVGEKPVGRILASVAPVNSALEQEGKPRGMLGAFEAENKETAGMLLAAGEAWLREKSAELAIGPMTFNTWFPYRFRVDSHECAYFWEPNNPPFYREFWLNAGYAELQRYNSPAATGMEGLLSAGEKSFAKARGAGFDFRPFDSVNLLTKEVPILYELSQLGFADNFLFEPLSFPLFHASYAPLAGAFDFSYSAFALSPAGTEIGFFLIFVHAGMLVLKTIAVLPEYRGQGLSTALTVFAARRAQAEGIQTFVTALILDGNHSESFSRKGVPAWTHRYALYSKSL